MNQRTFYLCCYVIAGVFTAIFISLVIPALLADRDVLGAFAAGFVNPYASGYSTDVILCWVTLLAWVLHDLKLHSIRFGWVCLLLGVVPGVAVGLPLYLVLRGYQIEERKKERSFGE